jgi:uncharacterized protein YbcI
MPDQEDVQTQDVAGSDLSIEIGRSLASVWTRYFGARPEQAETQLGDSVVRWVLADGTRQFEEGMSAEPDESEPERAPRTLAGYKRDTSAAVSKATHRKVVAMMSSHDAKTGVATETFILEGIYKKY